MKQQEAAFTKYYSLLSIIILSFIPNFALGYWSLEVASGVPYNFPMPLTIMQSGEPTIDMTAHYESRPFESPFYYMIRVGKWEGDTAWEIETIHHKIYLQNTTDEVSSFSISDGYNLFTVNRAWLTKQNFIWRLGAGLVLAHPESVVRGQAFDETGGTLNDWGFYIAGPTVMGSIGKRFYVTRSFFVELEGKVTVSYATVPVANGDANAPDIALHGNIGIGYDFFK